MKKDYIAYDLKARRLEVVSKIQWLSILQDSKKEIIDGMVVISKDQNTFMWQDTGSVEDDKIIMNELHWKYNIYKGVM